MLILTTFDLDDYVYEALRAGASGFLLKDAPGGELVHAVRVVAAGDALLAPSITKRLIAEFASRRERHPGTPAGARRTDPTGTRGPATDRPRHVQRRDRSRAVHHRADDQDPRRQDPDEAASARPRAGGRPRLRVRPDLTQRVTLAAIGYGHPMTVDFQQPRWEAEKYPPSCRAAPGLSAQRGGGPEARHRRSDAGVSCSRSS